MGGGVGRDGSRWGEWNHCGRGGWRHGGLFGSKCRREEVHVGGWEASFLFFFLPCPPHKEKDRGWKQVFTISLSPPPPMKLTFRQPLFWSRVLKLVHQLYLRNDSVTHLVSTVHPVEGLRILVFNSSRQFHLHVSPQACVECYIPVPATLKPLPVDWMLQFLNQWEPRLVQKQYAQMDLRWQWEVDEFHAMASGGAGNNGSPTPASWGPHGSALRLRLMNGGTEIVQGGVEENGPPGGEFQQQHHRPPQSQPGGTPRCSILDAMSS